MATITKFEDIQAWQVARKLTEKIYRLCKDGELAKDFGLKDQIRRSAVSIGSNIAEGYGREGNKEFVRFLKIAKGSCNEFRSQLYNLLDAEYIDKSNFEKLYSESCDAEKLIGGFIKYLENSKPN